MHAGADVLGSVGAFIEGPGFLPHLTGHAEPDRVLAGHRTADEEADLEEALEIAGLGTASTAGSAPTAKACGSDSDRPGHARAAPLAAARRTDERTRSATDQAMRAVLADYAATGRTVVVSRHLLAEVEQTCSHVVVMHLGKVILTGPMAELTATEDVTLVGTGRSRRIARWPSRCWPGSACTRQATAS